MLSILPILPGYILLLYMPESLRFVISKGKVENIIFVLNRINRINSWFSRQREFSNPYNHTKILSNMISLENNDSNDESKVKSSSDEQYTEKLYKRPWITRLIVLAIIWTGAGFAVEGFVIWLPTIVSFYTKGNKCRHYGHQNSSWSLSHPFQHVNQSSCTNEGELVPVLTNILFGNLLGLPFPLLCVFLLNRVGRKWLSFIIISLTGLSIFFMWLFDSMLSTRILVLIFSMIVNCIWVPLMIWTVELFPTSKRSTVVGILNIFLTITCGIGLMVVAIIFTTHCTLTLLLFSFLCIAAGLACIILPDTNKRDIG